jgi:hypothetical protein
MLRTFSCKSLSRRGSRSFNLGGAGAAPPLGTRSSPGGAGAAAGEPTELEAIELTETIAAPLRPRALLAESADS